MARWQQQGRLDNLTLVENDLIELPNLVLPKFAMVLVSRLAGELNDADLSALIQWCSESLEPGGLLLIDYPALPGAYAMAALRDLAQAVSGAGKSIDAAMAYFDELEQLDAPVMATDAMIGPAYEWLLHSSPAMQKSLLFGATFHPRHMTQLALLCEAAGLQFAGACGRLSAPDKAEMTAKLVPIEEADWDNLSLEQHLCFALNESWRSDLFVRPGPAGEDSPWSRLSLWTPSAAFQTIEQGMTWHDLETAVALRGCLPAFTNRRASRAAGQFNAIALQNAVIQDHPSVTLAISGIGCGMNVRTLDALWLRARFEAGESAAVEWATAELDRLHKTVSDGSANGPDRILAAAFSDSASRLATYVQLGLDQW